MTNNKAKTAVTQTKDGRKRNWTWVVYEDSAPSNWVELLESQHVPIVISPVHDADVNPTGEKKKKHWHVVAMFRGKQQEATAQTLSDLCSGVKVQPVLDIVAMSRYLCHLDNPEKAQYNKDDVRCLSGVRYRDLIRKTGDTEALLGDMMDWCMEQGCFSFYHLANYARNNEPEWFHVISTQRTVFLTAWLKSMKWDADNGTL